jgi:hypothetical protein
MVVSTTATSDSLSGDAAPNASAATPTPPCDTTAAQNTK